MILDALGLKGQLASLGCQVTQVPKAGQEVLGFQASQVYRAIPAKEVLQEFQANQDPQGLQVVQLRA